MRKLQKLFMLFLLLSIACFGNACAEEEEKEYVTISGHVYQGDHGTFGSPPDGNLPIANATVSTSLDSATVVTDANGYFELKTNSNTEEAYTITIQATGYQTFSVEHDWGMTPSNQTFYLGADDNDYVTIKGNVYEGNHGSFGSPANGNQPIANATVGTSLDSVTVVTDANGYFELKTNSNTEGPYTITIQADSYRTFSVQHEWGDHPINQTFYLGADTNDYVTISGNIYEGNHGSFGLPPDGNQPIANATVSTSLDSATVVANADGSFELITNTPTSQSDPGKYTITIQADGYKTFSVEHEWAWSYHPPDITFYLGALTDETNYVTIKGNVYDGNHGSFGLPPNGNLPIAGATVSTSLDSATAVTDANGYFELKTNTPTSQSDPGKYTITIQADSYRTFSVEHGWAWSYHPPGITFYLGADDSNYVTIKGNVYQGNHGTGGYPPNGNLPIANATVSTSLDSVTVVTDANGYFELKTNSNNEGPYTITIQAAGYQTFSVEHDWGSHPSDQTFYLGVDENEYVIVSGHVYQGNHGSFGLPPDGNLPIANATVSTSLDSVTVVTNADGYFELRTNSVEDGPYTITIQAEGYQTFSVEWEWGSHPYPSDETYYLGTETE
ncbi:MAG: hypothetical protein GY714_22150 [Desulfobacterales bacterium]|nr:hypothetical protein [Desulfobacterales bacterium]